MTPGAGTDGGRGKNLAESAPLKVRPLLPLAGDRRLARETAELAGRHYPPGWIRRSNERSEMRVTGTFAIEGAMMAILSLVTLLVAGYGPAASLLLAAMAWVVVALWLRKVGAGRYSGLGPGIVSLGELEGKEREANIVHELGHRMQDVVPGLVERERTFLEEKTGRRVRRYPPAIAAVGRLLRGLGKELRLVPRGRGADDSHGFYHPYAAFDPLDGRAFEVFTMGHQGLLYGAYDPRTRTFDPKMKPHADHGEFVERVLREL